MATTFLSLVQSFYREMGYSGVAPTTVVSQVSQKRKAVDWVAEAEYIINTRWADWSYLWTQWSTGTSNGTANYSAPSNIGTWDKESFYLNYTSDTFSKLEYMPYKEWRENFRQGTQSNAEPDIVTILPDKSVTLQSPPNGVYTLTADYWKTPTKMTTNTEVTPIPDRFTRIIIVRAKLIHAEHFGDMPLYQQAVGEYSEMLNRLESDQLPGRYDRHSQSMQTDIVVM